MTRLTLVLTEWPPAVGGMQTHARHLAQHLAHRADAVEVLTYRVTDRDLAQQAEQFDAECGVTVRRVLSRLGYWHNLATVAQHARDFRADAVYASTVFYGLLRARMPVPVVCRSVGNDVLRPWLGYPYPWCSGLAASPALQRAMRWWLEHGQHPNWVDRVLREARERVMRAAAAGNHAILANSDYTAGLLRTIGVAPERVDVVAGGVDARRFDADEGRRRLARDELGFEAEDRVVLTVCRLVEKKGVEVLLDAVAALRAATPRVRLVVVGDGRKRAAYEARAAALGLRDAVRFAGRVPHEDIPRYYWASDVFALASYESRHAGGRVRDVETMGRVLCEANAAGLPLVASASGGIPSVVRDGDNGLLVAPGDAGAFAHAIARVLREPALAARLSRRGRERAQHEFDWSAVLGRHERAIDEAIRAA
ncbi:glycosyltransferase family 4 protein [Ramlibacter sp. PS4R-6]|uniref:glycosyltransferase family 4 protein n=1 Tax=Ramlibacter sp. PS4R-6 TaxID=3133438 RepID=UPI0030A9E9CA